MSSVDLSVNFAGMKLKNPIIVTASDVSRNVWQLEEAEKYGAAAIILKAISIDPKALKSKPRFHFENNSMFGFGGSKRLTIEECEALIKDAKKTVTIPLGVNIIYSKPEYLSIYKEIAQRMEEAGADFIEVNFFPPTMKTPEPATIPGLIYEGVKAIKQIVNVPLVTKITPVDLDVAEAAKAMEKAGSDMIHAIDAVSGAPKIDINNHGNLLLKGVKNTVLWLSGDYLRPIAQASVVKIARTVNIPVLGTGGLIEWKHAVEMIMFGASATGICTNVMIHGFEVISKILKEIESFMERSGFTRIDDFKGLALENMLHYSTDVEILPVVATIDKEVCNGCGLCLKPGHCGLDRRAISIIEEKAEVEQEQCLGCGTCFNVCPIGAVSML